MRNWMTRMGLSAGGETAKALRDQARRISACHIKPPSRLRSELPAAEPAAFRPGGRFTSILPPGIV